MRVQKAYGQIWVQTVHITESRSGLRRSVLSNTLARILAETWGRRRGPKQPVKQASRRAGTHPERPRFAGGLYIQNSVMAELQDILRKTAKDT